MKPSRRFALLLLTLVTALVMAQTTPTRVRGSIEEFDNSVLTVKTREGSTVKIKAAENLAVNGVVALRLADIVPGKYVGTASVPQPDGSEKALEVLVFPDAMRGSGEGHYPWDLQPNSMMTNAEVAQVVTIGSNREMILRYKDGERKVLVVEGTPIVSFTSLDRTALKAGVRVFVVAQRQPDGSLTAARVTVELNGVVPPM